ncbi:MAG: Stk1 family PASTA domain-containing Ser/Thr kinase [Mycobacteriales bacterium]
MDVTVTDPLVGRLLDGRYRVEGRIARGGMASVYVATDTRLDRTVAVKVMHAALADDEEFVARFIREARSAARLSHPNVVAVFDQGADGDAVFLVMEYVPGHTLRDLLRARGQLRPAEALAVMEPVLAALAAAHDAGLVHRDVKPENVLLAPDGRVKVADFGLARAVAGAHLTGSAGLLIGTVAYLAPEQVQTGRADARSDVYAAGVLLFELLTGRTPFTGETPIAVAYRHVNEDVPAPSSLAAEVPAQVDALVARATARDPQYRPVDAGALLVSLASARDVLGYHDQIPTLPGGAGSGAGAVDRATGVLATGTLATGALVTGTLGSGALGSDTGVLSAAQRRRRARWPYLLAVLLLLAAAAGVAGWWFGSGQYTSAPGVLGLAYRTAATRLTRDGLHLRLGTPTYSDTVPKGEVVSQDPRPRARMHRGGTVTVHLSLGVLMKTVPDLRGDTIAQATAALRKNTFVVAGQQSVYSSSVRQGLVVTTRPAPGRVLRHGSAITLVVSAGPQPVVVPSVDNTALPQAESALRARGLTFSVAPAVYSSTVASGYVVSESPAGGLTVPVGTTVVLTPSRGPQLFAVPSVAYLPVGQAEAVLQAAGFQFRVESLPGGPGIVLKQSPGGGSMRPRGSTVTLYVF